MITVLMQELIHFHVSFNRKVPGLPAPIENMILRYVKQKVCLVGSP
jgi:PROCN (NUC071) domain